MATVIEDTQRSELERKLLRTPPYQYAGMVRELDVLRDVLIGRSGTAAQRNALLRIIKANAPGARLVMGKLSALLATNFAEGPLDHMTFAEYDAEFRPDIEAQIEAEGTEEEDDDDDD